MINLKKFAPAMGKAMAARASASQAGNRAGAVAPTSAKMPPRGVMGKAVGAVAARASAPRVGAITPAMGKAMARNKKV